VGALDVFPPPVNESPHTVIEPSALRAAWGSPYFGGTGAPTDSGYTKIYSNAYAFAALKANGSIKGCVCGSIL
jgi:hypothetical protein